MGTESCSNWSLTLAAVTLAWSARSLPWCKGCLNLFGLRRQNCDPHRPTSRSIPARARRSCVFEPITDTDFNERPVSYSGASRDFGDDPIFAILRKYLMSMTEQALRLCATRIPHEIELQKFDELRRRDPVNISLYLGCCRPDIAQFADYWQPRIKSSKNHQPMLKFVVPANLPSFR